MFAKLKIGPRLGLAFATLVSFLVVISVVGISRLGLVSNELNQVLEDRYPKTVLANDVIDGVNNVTALVYKAAISKPEQATQLFNQLPEMSKVATERLEKLEKMVNTEKGHELLKKIKETRVVFAADIAKAKDLILAGKRDEAAIFTSGQMSRSQELYLKANYDMLEFQTSLMNKQGEDTRATYASARVLLIGLMVCALVLAVVVAWLITRSITGPVSQVVDAARKMAAGDFGFELKSTAQDEMGEVVRSVAQVQGAVMAMSNDAQMLSAAAVAGKLATRADADKHYGDFRKIVQGVNDTLNAVINPLNVAAGYVDRITKGDIPPKIADNYNGDFNAIKNNLNSLIDTLNNFEAAQKKIWQEHAAGAIDYKIPAEQFEGCYRRIADGINKLVQSHIDVKMHVVDVVKRYADGDFTVDIDRLPGKKAQITQAIDGVKASLQAMHAEIMRLVEAAVAGKLATRADAGKFRHGFKAMMEGFNQTLDAVINPLNVAAGYVDRISKGDIPPKITDSYNGDFNSIKNNLNTCIEAVGKLVQDAVMLSEAAVEGRLSTRADASQHQGDFRKIVDGVNTTLDNVIGPINEVSRILEALSKGDLTQTIHGNYLGDFGKLQDDSNTTVMRLSDVVKRIKEATEAIETASKEIAAGNQDLSGRTEEQASSLEETASSMEQLTTTVKQNAESAKQANELAEGAQQVAEKGGEVVGQVVSTMGAIHQSSSKIADIIGVIDGIAFQTNILALNAAVEAARAGEQGRGFAVVASEVRNLAQRSAAAAKEIKGLISDSVEKVDAGTKLVDQAGQTMDEVVTSIKRVAKIMADISSASREQSAGIEQVSLAVSQMDEVTQQNAALVEEAAAAAESLEEQSRRLVDAVAVFRLDEGRGFKQLQAPAASAASNTVRTRGARVSAKKTAALPASLDDEWEEF